jgi:hypothetical protein
MQDRDVVGERQHEVHVVLDDDDGERRGQPLDQVAERLHGTAAEAAGRLVEQEQLGLTGERHADLQEPALTVGKVAGLDVLATGQADEPDDGGRPVLGLAERRRRRPAVEAAGPHDGHRHPEVLQHRVVVEQVQDLERATDPEAGAPVGREPRDVLPIEADLPGVGREQAAQQVEAGRLAGAVRADQRRQAVRLEGDADAVQDDVAAEGLPEPAGLEDRAHRMTPVGRPAASGARVSWKPVGRRARRASPRMPSGMKRITPMKSRP